jgi:hypothetical protein
LYLSLKSDRDALDMTTYCPKSGPKDVTAVLIDRTDGISERQAGVIKNLIQRWASEVPKNGAFRVYEVTGNPGLESPKMSVCNPGTGEDANPLISNPGRESARYKEKFGDPLNAMIVGMQSDTEASVSPIMEAIQGIVIQEFSSGAERRRLILVSDLMQHTPEFSLYKDPPDIQEFRKSPYGRKVEVSLRGVSVEVQILRSSSSKQSDEVGQFWLDWLYLQGADLQPPMKVPG